MEMRLRTPVTRGYFFLLGASRLVNAASPRSIDQKKISSGTQGSLEEKWWTERISQGGVALISQDSEEKKVNCRWVIIDLQTVTCKTQAWLRRLH